VRKAYRFSKMLAWSGCALFGLSFAACFGLALGGLGSAATVFSILALVGLGLMVVCGIASLIASERSQRPPE
jgi:hypothetical protein